MPLVQDFVPVAERFEQAGMVLVSGRGSWLAEHARAAVAPARLTTGEFNAPRSLEHAVIVPVRWIVDGGPFVQLDGDLRLEPVPPQRSHLSLSGAYEMESPGASLRDAVNLRRLTESCVRHFLVAVAATLEHRGDDSHEMSMPSRVCTR
jgi:hypothetical protein